MKERPKEAVLKTEESKEALRPKYRDIEERRSTAPGTRNPMRSHTS